MPPATPNLLQALFEFHPRDGHWPKENFLTEAFAYLLRTDPACLNAWLSTVSGKSVTDAVCDISTRASEKDIDAKTTIYPDLRIEGCNAAEDRIDMFFEHKWESPCDEKQLESYRKLAKSRNATLFFVGANRCAKSPAARCLDGQQSHCFLWEDVYCSLNSITNKSTLLTEFLEFMKMQGLSPGKPLTVERMRAYLDASDFIATLLNYANKLNDNYSWEAIPQRFHAVKEVRDRWGRVGIRFRTTDWRPFLTVGFLHDGPDHRVTLVDRQRGIDLLLRIEAEPEDTEAIEPVVDVLREKRKSLKETAASVLLKGEPAGMVIAFPS